MSESEVDAHARRLAAGSADPLRWFERLYQEAADGRAEVPWDREEPSVALVDWAADQRLGGVSTLVVGCGLGRDSEFLARRGALVVAFDVSCTAIETARRRHPGSPVSYVLADLLDLPERWNRAFDLVVESMTVQALPEPLRARAICAVGGSVGPGGRLLVLEAGRRPVDPIEDGPPWPLTRAEIDAFAHGGLVADLVEERQDPLQPSVRRWRAEFHRPR